MQCLPDNLRDQVYYRPTNEGIEKRIRERLAEIRHRRSPETAGGPAHPRLAHPEQDPQP
jgi:replication-associated recombination protein RarA